MTTTSDPVGLEVLKNALEGIADGMALTLVRTSRTTIMRTSLDLSTAVLNAKGEIVGQGMTIPFHLGGMEPALQACLQHYQGRIKPGDVLANNDPYEGASHLPDIYLYKPAFVGETLAGYLGTVAHHVDIGGRAAGGIASDSTEIYQEGLRIPPLKLYEEGQANETLFSLIEKAVRVPDKVLADLAANIAALAYGERELLKLVQRYSVEEYNLATNALLGYTETLARRGIRNFSDGSWSFVDYVDDDGFGSGPIVIKTNLSKRDDEIVVDFTGSSTKCKGAIQTVLPTTRAMVYGVLRGVLEATGYHVPNTGGYFRPVKVIAPAGCVVNPMPPAPVAARSLIGKRIQNALFGAFAQMLPNVVFAAWGGCEFGITISGYDRSRQPWQAWVHVEFGASETAVGGHPHADGQDAQRAGTSNEANVPAEILEAELPIRVEEYTLQRDTEGAGMHRGGLGMAREFCFLADHTAVQVACDRMKHRPYGLYGGLPGSATRIWVTNDDQTQAMPSKFAITLNRGDRLRVEWSGAGGWGDPTQRDPQRVLEDVIGDKMSAQRAKEVYQVVVDAEHRTIDREGTKRLRTGTKE